MPHIDSNSDAIIPDPVETPMTAEAAQRVEQEKLTRRATLRKLGFGAGLAAFSLLGVDDFARMVGQRLQRNAHDNKTAMAVAKEFQSAGIALADNPSGTYVLSPACTACYTDAMHKTDDCGTTFPAGTGRDDCNRAVSNNLMICLHDNKCPGG